MKYSEWLKNVPSSFSNDALWHMQLYRTALFVGDLAWHDSRKLIADRSLISLADQLYRAAGSISANISEGYSRASPKDQARFYEYALGSAREARDWYFKSRFVLTEPVVRHRLDLLTDVIRQLLVLVPRYRGTYIREDQNCYESNEQTNLLQEIPMSK